MVEEGKQEVQGLARGTLLLRPSPGSPAEALAGPALFGILFLHPNIVDVVEDSDKPGHCTQLC